MDEFFKSINPISKPDFAWIRCIQLKLWPFLWYFCHLTKIWLPLQRPSDPCKQICLLWIGWPRKPPVISNHVLVIYRRTAFICIYSNFSPQIGCRGNAASSLVYGSVTDEFSGTQCTDHVSEANSAWICRIQLKLWPFFVIFYPFWPKFGCRDNVPYTPAIRNVFFGLINP